MPKHIDSECSCYSPVQGRCEDGTCMTCSSAKLEMNGYGDATIVCKHPSNPKIPDFKKNFASNSGATLQ